MQNAQVTEIKPPIEGHNAAKIAAHLSSAVRDSQEGEIVFSNGSDVGRVYLHRGNIAWVHMSSRKVYLGRALQEEAGISEETRLAVIAECRKTGKNLGETLLEWKLITEEILSKCLRKHVVEHLWELLGMTGRISILFVAQTRPYNMGLVFGLEKLFEAAGCGDLLRKEQSPDSHNAAGDEGSESRLAYALTQIPKVVAVGFVDIGGPGARLLQHRAATDEGTEVWQHTAVAAKDLFEPSTVSELRKTRDRVTPGSDAEGYFEEVLQLSSQYFHFFGRTGAKNDQVFVAICSRRASLGMVLSKCKLVCQMQPVVGALK